MPKSKWPNLIKRTVLVGISINLVAFVQAPKVDDLIELTGWINARKTADFSEGYTKNIIRALPTGTRGKIEKIQHFPETKNYGVCISVEGAEKITSGDQCLWVYYEVKKPNLKLFTGITTNQALVESQTTNPSKAKIAETIKPVQAIVEPKVAAKPIDTSSAVTTAVGNIDQFNLKGKASMNPGFCAECAKRVESYASCNPKNDYLENDLLSLTNNTELNSIFSGSNKEIISKSCIQRSLDAAPDFRNGYKYCGPGKKSLSEVRHSNKACVSEKYVDVTAKSFNLVADCMADLISGSPANKSETALALFSLTSWESGLHMNAVSPTGAGGIGQFTGAAIESVNQRLKGIQEHLKKSANPLCSNTLAQVMSTPMSSTGNQSCDRIAVSKDNPLKNMAYTFAFQAAQRKMIEENVLNSSVFSDVLSKDLPSNEKERLAMSLSIWSHNTGSAGMTTPLRAQMMEYLRSKKSIKNGEDVSKFLKEMETSMAKFPNSGNATQARVLETSRFFRSIQERVSVIAKEPRSCIVN